MDQDTYLSIGTDSSGQYKEKGSKFLAFAYPVEAEVEIKSKIDVLKKQFHDAHHHCYAYMLGIDQSLYRANDDGEPKHSAGDPILNQIRSFNLSDTLIIVVRYFGGTKLGVPGLIHAYKTSAREALNNNKIIKKIVTEQINVFFSYEVMSVVMRLANEPGIRILDQQFTDKCQVQLSVRKSLVDQTCDRLTGIKGVNIDEAQ
jgi:uncharacterized YigZ family protein